MVKKKLLLCIHSKQLLLKISNSLKQTFHLTIQSDLDSLSNNLLSNTSFCIFDQGSFRNGGKEALTKIREKFPHVGRGIIARRMTLQEMREAVNDCHVYAIWDKGLRSEELLQTIQNSIEERERRLHTFTRENEVQLLKDEKENLIDAFNHEIRSAIAPISLSLRALKKEISSEKSIKAFQRIDNKIRRLTKIMERLLSFQSMEKGKYFFQVMELNISEAITLILESTRFFIKEEGRRVKITSNIPKDVVIVFDELMFWLALEEVLQNAVKYTTDNSSIHVSLQAEKDFLIVIVEDKGIGLNCGDLDSVWEVGYENLKRENRSSGYYKFRSSGVGLGLSLVKKYLTMFGADCLIESDGRCPAVPICVPADCPLAGAEESICEEMVRVNCRYVCPGDTSKCDIVAKKLQNGWCPGSRVTITLPR